MDNQPGRSCPIHYRYTPGQLCMNPQPANADVIYIAGGLYGNPFALDTLEELVEQEQKSGQRVRLIFNGDFNWFNRTRTAFEQVNTRVLNHDIVLGNVEYELANPTPEAGCGCAYPEFVDEEVVERSNRIMRELQSVAVCFPDIQSQLRNAPRWRCLDVAGQKLLILHGDPQSLAGWGLAYEYLSRREHRQTVAEWFNRTGADLIACTHTCLPAIWQDAKHTVVNNGSAGMGNLIDDPRGLVIRIGLADAAPPPTQPLTAVQQGSLSVSLMPVSFDHEGWLTSFDAWWPAGSDAALSYRERIVQGTALAKQAILLKRP